MWTSFKLALFACLLHQCCADVVGGGCRAGGVSMLQTATQRSQLPGSGGAVGGHPETSLLDTNIGSEPRVALVNKLTGKSLTVTIRGPWHRKWWPASTSCENNRCDWFKLQKKEWDANGFPSVLVIRTDWHPQALLDRNSMNFEGSAHDAGKTHKSTRWWNPVMLSVHENGEKVDASVMAFRTDDSKNENWEQYLALNGDKVHLKSVRKGEEIPESAQWVITVIGSSLSPGEAWKASFVAPVAVAAAVASGGLAAGAYAGIGAAWIASTGGIAAAGAVAGAAAGAQTLWEALSSEVANTFFVHW